MLDGEIRNALRGIEHAWRADRVRRAGFNAERARTALIERRGVRFQIQAADDLAEEDPRTELGIDDAGVLADPADAGVARVDALLDRTGVDIRTCIERLGRDR